MKEGFRSICSVVQAFRTAKPQAAFRRFRSAETSPAASVCNASARWDVKPGEIVPPRSFAVSQPGTSARYAVKRQQDGKFVSAFIACFFVYFLVAATCHGADSSARGLKICVSADAPAPIRHAAETVLAAAKTNPLLTTFCGSKPPVALTDTKTLLAAKPESRAFDHLVLIGLSDDPMIRAAWQREARPESGGFYIFGFGHLTGDIGYVESDRNPFLHGRTIPKAPYETEVVTVTGSTPAGVAMAANAFLNKGLFNGVVASDGWKRPTPSLLDRDPLAPSFDALQWLPAQAGRATRIGLSQAGEDEYRGVLEDAGVEPLEIWRVKYLIPGAWDGAGAAMSIDDYAAGLQRRAYGNTVWAARFTSSAQATASATKIANAAHLKASTGGWTGAQPPYSSEKKSPGVLTLWQRGEWLLMSSLPDPETAALRKDLH